jgi:hypothetical protein
VSYDLFQLTCICEIVGDQFLFWYFQLLLSLLSECNQPSCQVDQPTPLKDYAKGLENKHENRVLGYAPAWQNPILLIVT